MRRNSIPGGNPWQGYTFKLNTKNLDLTTTKTVSLDVYATGGAGEFVKYKLDLMAQQQPRTLLTQVQGGKQLQSIFHQILLIVQIQQMDIAEIIIFMNWDSDVDGDGNVVGGLVRFEKTFYIDNFVGVGVDKPAALTPPAAGPNTLKIEDVVSLLEQLTLDMILVQRAHLTNLGVVLLQLKK